MPIQKFSDQLLIYVNLYQHAKNQAISLIYSRDVVDLKILQFDWLKTFWHISQESEFSQIWDLCWNTANNTNFHYRTNSVKINDQRTNSRTKITSQSLKQKKLQNFIGQGITQTNFQSLSITRASSNLLLLVINYIHCWYHCWYLHY